MNHRRTFLKKLSEFSTVLAVSPFLQSSRGTALLQAFEQAEGQTLDQNVTDEEFWAQIRQAYTVSPTLINFNNGGVSPQPKVVQEAVEHYNRLSNETPSFFMWRVLDKGRETIRRRLSELLGCSADEVAINRNSSEALETIIFGLPLKAGDEVVLTRQDYPNMINAYKQREHRDGIKLNWISLDLPIEDDQQIVDAFVSAFTDRTRIVHITHMINWTGQILPVQKIAREAHARGIEVVVDAAHTFAHLNYKIDDLECDYWGTSLHKWLSAPFGSGMLYVKKEKISKLYPLFGAPDPESDDIRKFEHLGTRSFAIEQAIGHAINFFDMIGAERKQARLQYLKNYWAEKVSEFPGVSVGTSLKPEYACALCLLQIEGQDPSKVHNYLQNKHYIHTSPVKWENISGVRITPNVYTTTKELDVLVEAVRRYPG